MVIKSQITLLDIEKIPIHMPPTTVGTLRKPYGRSILAGQIHYSMVTKRHELENIPVNNAWVS